MSRYDSIRLPKAPGRNPYNCGTEIITDVGFGYWYPAGSYFAIPGDKVRVGQNCFVRTIPMKTVPFTSFHVKFVTFFTALRNLDENAEKIITGFDENENPFNGSFDDWKGINSDDDLKKWSLWDYFTFQNVTKSVFDKIPSACKPADYWRRNYYRIYNEWLRMPKLQDEVDEETNNELMHANYKRDRYTTADIYPQMTEIDQSIPLEASNSVAFNAGDDVIGYVGNKFPMDTYIYPASGAEVKTGTLKKGAKFAINVNGVPSIGGGYARGSGNSDNDFRTVNIAESPFLMVNPFDPPTGTLNNARVDSLAPQGYSPSSIGDLNAASMASVYQNGSTFGLVTDDSFRAWLNQNSLDVNGGFGINNLRLAFAKQLLDERMNSVGSRYNEYLRANYGIAPRDETLQRPVFLGSSVAPVLVNEVTQQSESNKTPLGDIAGKGVSMTTSYTGSYVCKEFGVVQTLMCIVPDVYYSQGIPKMFTYKSRYDFFNPLFQALGEVDIKNSELYVNGTSGVDGDDDAYGYQMLYEEMKVAEKRISGSFRDNLESFTLARKFSERPFLNGEFVKCVADRDNLNRIFSVTDDTLVKPFHIHLYNIVRALRPLIRFPVQASLKGM